MRVRPADPALVGQEAEQSAVRDTDPVSRTAPPQRRTELTPMSTGTTRVSPAAAVWSDHDAVRRSGHANHFAEHGFTVIPGLLDPEEVAECAAELDRLDTGWRDLPNVRVIGKRNPLAPSYDLEDLPGADGEPVVRKITGFTALSPVLERSLVRHPDLLEVLHQVLGPRVELYRDALMFKHAGVGQEKPWHQDAVYWPFRPMSLVSAMITVDRCTPDNGCLQVVPGSHREVVAHAKVDWELQVDQRECARRAVYVPLEPGDCLVFHSLILHASEHNRSTVDRRLAITSYSPGGLEILDEEIDSPVLISERVG
ncbi:phytanoyl-CoA hydroxylase [Actinokineospora baliensis]|uniref:phytanoyl-CoA dioxygenase family protein n=1 Tax=Actinokineospora baliensis TaxID=547056 RepID=UPI00195CFE7F|nr:phytanoyl-CoA dioxygenase family protein [Actinokineospora baliensis]MBM7774420.1 phytanoyl-CoA hydroxylase [Actinokineospora baliensis]